MEPQNGDVVLPLGLRVRVRMEFKELATRGEPINDGLRKGEHMRLGTDTGSMTNYLMSGTKGVPTPTVGMGITELMWSDRAAGTITRVSPSGKTLWYQLDKATRIDDNGMSEVQDYAYEPDPTATVKIARLTKRGWKASGTRLALGYRDTYYDFSF